MSLLYPTRMLKSVTDIAPDMLASLCVKALLLDLDNTLTTHNNPVPDPSVSLWIRGIQEQGIRLMLVSNNNPRRVMPFAAILGLPFTADAAKPLTTGFREATKRLELLPRDVAVVGDQIFTDILGGNLFGAKTILVEPIEPETTRFFRLKRRLEAGILKTYRKKTAGRNEHA